MSLEGRTILVTGGGSGIGRAMAAGFHAAGATVLVVDVRPDAAAETVSGLGGGDRLVWLQADVSDPASVDALGEQVVRRGVAVDVLCNNAGVFDDYTPAHETELALWEAINAVNVTGPFLMSSKFLPGMMDRGRGVVINTASIASVVAGAGGAAYTASKHALLGLTRQIAFDYGRHGIRANAICPGVVATEMSRKAQGGGSSHIERMVSITPAGRWAQPEEIAEVAVFLAGDGSSFMTGDAVMVDGGWTLT